MIKTYKHPTDERTMIITQTDVGEYGYLIEHKLLGMNDRPIKSRLFHFDNDQRILTEEVTTHNIDPIHKTTRQQKIRVSHFQLNPRPILVLDE